MLNNIPRITDQGVKMTKKKNKRILKLRRQIAALNGREGFAFDVPQCSQSEYDQYQSPRSGLEKSRMLLSYFDCPIDVLKKFTALIRTDTGCYRLSHVVSVVRDLTPGSERIYIAIKSPEALQKTKIFDFKILDASGKCIYVSIGHFSTFSSRVGDTFNPNYTIKV